MEEFLHFSEFSESSSEFVQKYNIANFPSSGNSQTCILRKIRAIRALLARACFLRAIFFLGFFNAFLNGH